MTLLSIVVGVTTALRLENTFFLPALDRNV